MKLITFNLADFSKDEIIQYNEDNEVRKESEKKIEQYDNEEDNEEIPISK